MSPDALPRPIPGLQLRADPLQALRRRLEEADPRPVKGRVVKAIGVTVHAEINDARLGEICELRDPQTGHSILAEVVGLVDGAAVLTPIGSLQGLSTRTEAIPTGRALRLGVGPALLGRVLDSLGRPLDTAERGPLDTDSTYPLHAEAPPALLRPLISRPMPLGIRAIDGLLTCGEGQRIGIYGSPGTGKSSLLAQIVKGADADAIVIGLIGERGREVREFIDRHLGPQALRRAVIVTATSDRPAIERVKAAFVATAIAEYFRDQGMRVALLMDSITRFARAVREIGLAAGEPPTRRGFPPSFFAMLPRLLERAGPAATGSITGFYTVLVEGDAETDPIADETRGLLDGHVVLSQALASAGHFPAIDVLASRSRVMDAVIDTGHRRAAVQMRRLMAKHADIELLLQVGEYRAGADALADEAVAKIGDIRRFLQQDFEEATPFAQTREQLERLSR